MNDTKDLTKIKGLLESVASRNAPFYSSCCETKILAYTNRGQAVDKYRDIARQALLKSIDVLGSHTECKKKLTEVQRLLDKESQDGNILSALTSLRSTYLNEVLKPAVRAYLNEGEKESSEVEKLYERIFTLDGLIEVAQFFDRVDPF